MGMGALYNRQGERKFEEEWRKRVALLQQYIGSVIEDDDRVTFSHPFDPQYTIKCLKDWKHRFMGITKEGTPVWVRKGTRVYSVRNELCWHVMPESREELFTKVGQCSAEEVQSFFSWIKNRKKTKLAFIYLGIFWTLNEEESLNDAAKRFIETYPDVKELFDKQRQRKAYHWIKEEQIYLYEIFKDGAAVFSGDTIYMSSSSGLISSPSSLWWVMASEGFFSNENILYARTISDEELSNIC